MKIIRKLTCERFEIRLCAQNPRNRRYEQKNCIIVTANYFFLNCLWVIKVMYKMMAALFRTYKQLKIIVQHFWVFSRCKFTFHLFIFFFVLRNYSDIFPLSLLGLTRAATGHRGRPVTTTELHQQRSESPASSLIGPSGKRGKCLQVEHQWVLQKIRQITHYKRSVLKDTYYTIRESSNFTIISDYCSANGFLSLCTKFPSVWSAGF